MRVLIIEDEQRLARNISKVLKEEMSFAVDISHDGLDGRHMAMTNPYDLIILDLMLPKVSGLEILQHLRQKNNEVAVLVLSARDTQKDKIKGLRMGCDDYMTKPFDMDELLARCNALIRRCYNRVIPLLKVGPITIDTTSHIVTCKGKQEILPAMEYRLLEYLAMRTGQIVSKTDIIEHLYDFYEENFSNVIEVYISSLRKRFDNNPKHKLIHTIRGQGYMLKDKS